MSDSLAREASRARLAEQPRWVLIERDPREAVRLVALLEQTPDGIPFRWLGSVAESSQALRRGEAAGLLYGFGDELERALQDVGELRRSVDAPLLALLPEHGDEHAVEAIRAGAHECIVKRQLDSRGLAHAIARARERYVLEKLMRDSVAQAQRVSLGKSNYVASVCHEIRAPLHVVLGMAELLDETSLSGHQRDCLRRLRGAGDHLSALLDDVVDLARTESGHLVIDRVACDLHELIQSTVDLMGAGARAKGIDFSFTIEPGVATSVIGDPRRLRQVLVNLLGNAIKFTDRGRVHLLVEPARTTGSVERTHFAASDTGIGIPPDRLGDIFTDFVQVDPRVTRDYGGFGLGLHIAKKLVEMMDGRIWVESRLGHGSTFHLEVPLPVRRGLTARPSVRSLVAVREPEVPAAGVIRVLLVDDSADNRMLVKSYVARTEIVLEVADGGARALEIFADRRFDLVLMDMHMPDMDGFAVTKELRRWEKEQSVHPVPVVGLTADVMRETIARCLAVGCAAHVAKPVSKATLLAVIRRWAKHPASATVETNGGADSAVPSVPRYLANRRRDVEAMRAAVERGDMQRVETLAHNMKGTGASYGLRAVTDVGRSLEEAAAARDGAAVTTQIDRLQRFLERAEAEARATEAAADPDAVATPRPADLLDR